MRWADDGTANRAAIVRPAKDAANTRRTNEIPTRFPPHPWVGRFLLYRPESVTN